MNSVECTYSGSVGFTYSGPPGPFTITLSGPQGPIRFAYDPSGGTCTGGTSTGPSGGTSGPSGGPSGPTDPPYQEHLGPTGAYRTLVSPFQGPSGPSGPSGSSGSSGPFLPVPPWTE